MIQPDANQQEQAMQLNRMEIELTIEAVEAWENEKGRSAFTSMLITGMLAPKDNREKLEREMKNLSAKAEIAGRNRKERGTILRAKLIQMRDAMLTAEQLAPAVEPVQ